MTSKHVRLCAGIALACLAIAARAEDRLRLNESIVLGNGEQPRVTYVVPWRDFPDEGLSADSLHFEGTPLETVERETLQRSLEFGDLLHGEEHRKIR